MTVAHRLLKSTVRDRIGPRPDLFMTDAAATGLGLQGIGLAHGEAYPDAGQIKGRIVELGASAPGLTTAGQPASETYWSGVTAKSSGSLTPVAWFGQ